MNNNEYTSQLKGHAIDRAIQISKNSELKLGVEGVIAIAEKLVEYYYNPDEEIATLQELLDQKVYDKQMADAIALKPASNKLDEEQAQEAA